MYTSSLVLTAVVFPLLAAASIIPRDDCSGGDQQCCNSTQMETAASLPILGGLLGLTLPAVSGLVALGCTPLSVVIASGQTCSKQTVCCTNNSFNGVIALGCIVINV